MPASQLFRDIIDNKTQNMLDHNNGYGGGARPVRDMGGPNLRTVPSQRDLDAAMWYGAATTGAWRHLVVKIFSLFYHGGVMYNTAGNWFDFIATGHPVASLLSHGGRIVVQTPVFGARMQDPIWEWLNQPTAIPHRGFATHGLNSNMRPRPLMRGHRAYWSEEHGFFQSGVGAVSRRHYAVNIALGGRGKVNPFSAATRKVGDVTKFRWEFDEIQDDGRNGHLYIYYHGPRPTHKHGGLLIGCENVEHGRGQNPHTGAGHSASGAANAISACGGKKWSDWSGAPGPTEKYGGVFCDLSAVGNSPGAVGGWLNNLNFTADDLDEQPGAVPHVN